jgi:hypothetical protein
LLPSLAGSAIRSSDFTLPQFTEGSSSAIPRLARIPREAIVHGSKLFLHLRLRSFALRLGPELLLTKQNARIKVYLETVGITRETLLVQRKVSYLQQRRR